MECECATQFISGRAVCTAWWIMYAEERVSDRLTAMGWKGEGR